jgi:deoxyribodipyrimidine photolyase-related protein
VIGMRIKTVEKMYKNLRLILGDQLNINHTWFKENDGETLYVIMEILPETGYVKHHVQKVIGFLLAMRNFAQTLDNQRFTAKYFRLDDADNAQSFEENILGLIKKYNIKHFS